MQKLGNAHVECFDTTPPGATVGDVYRCLVCGQAWLCKRKQVAGEVMDWERVSDRDLVKIARRPGAVIQGEARG